MLAERLLATFSLSCPAPAPLWKRAGGRFVARTIVKSSKGVSCPATGNKIHGVSRTRPADFRRLPKCKRTVSRAYGGHLSHQAVKDK